VVEHARGCRMVSMELKYCERCGGLLLRRTGEAVVYCGPCGEQMRSLPPVQERKSRSAQPAQNTLEARATAAPVAVREAQASSDAEIMPARIPPQRATSDFEQGKQGSVA
jgi:uncharacterized Zn finger protein (UPF0148 family)